MPSLRVVNADALFAREHCCRGIGHVHSALPRAHYGTKVGPPRHTRSAGCTRERSVGCWYAAKLDASVPASATGRCQARDASITFHR
jgi:hypothetical protein